MKLKNILIAALAAVTLGTSAVALTACGGAESAEPGEKSETVSAESEASVQSAAEEPDAGASSVIPLSELKVNLFGVDYDLNNVTPRDFTDHGYVFNNTRYIDAIQFLHENAKGYLDLMVDWDQIDGKYDDETNTFPDAFYDQQINYICFNRGSYRKPGQTITFPKGIVFNESTYDDVIAAYGEPDDTYDDVYFQGQKYTWVYYKHFAGDWKLAMEIVTGENGYVSKVELYQKYNSY